MDSSFFPLPKPISSASKTVVLACSRGLISNERLFFSFSSCLVDLFFRWNCKHSSRIFVLIFFCRFVIHSEFVFLFIHFSVTLDFLRMFALKNLPSCLMHVD